jgi:hypothetical protein
VSFAGAQIGTLAEGEVTELHVGLKGTMGALFLKDLRDKTRRGLEGRVREGRSEPAAPSGRPARSTGRRPETRGSFGTAFTLANWSGTSAAG